MARLSEWDPKRGRQGRTWRRLVDKLCPPGTYCQVDVCREELRGGTREILFGLRQGHPLGRSLHHLVSPLDGGHPTAEWNLVPAHLGCNASIGRPGSRAPSGPRVLSRRYPAVDLSAG